MNAHLLVDAIVQQTMVFIAQLATAGGVRAPLAHVAERVFLDLTNELHSRGVKKNVIADMFGMALRTYHRRVRELEESRTDRGKTVWEAVLGFVREKEPVSGRDVLERFLGDDPEVVSGVLGDLVHSGLAYRSGRGDSAYYRVADSADFAGDDATRATAHEHLVWLAVYRNSPATEDVIASWTRLDKGVCAASLRALVESGRVAEAHNSSGIRYTADRFEVPAGLVNGWEAAVLDHFQAMVSAILAKLNAPASRGADANVIGGSTWSLDVWSGHPLEFEAKRLLAGTRAAVEDLRARIDAHNAVARRPAAFARVVFYVGQNVTEGTSSLEGESNEKG